MSTTEDRRRVRRIEQYDLLTRPPRSDLTAIAEMAAKICRAPMATINLITDVAQHQVAVYGFDAAICSRADSMCATVLGGSTPVVVSDASQDPRFRDNPFVTGALGRVRFYASHALTSLDGVTIGTLCVLDEVPRELDDSQVDALRTLAGRVVDVLELAQRSRDLAASNDRLTTFAGRVSHDLKTPLAGVTMSLEMLRDQLDDVSPDTQWLLERAIKSAERMASLIDEVLSYASVGASMADAPVSLDDLLDEVLVDLAVPYAGAEVTRKPLPVVRGDRVQLRSVLQNLLDNAAKYRHPARPLTVEVRAEERDGRCRLEVVDNGRGVPEHERDRVFAPRVRLSEDDLGWGIGLDTVRRVLQAHGGSVGILGTPGGGTTVWLDLPT